MSDQDLDRDRQLERRCRRKVRARVPGGRGAATKVLDEDPADAGEGVSQTADRACQPGILKASARRRARLASRGQPEDGLDGRCRAPLLVDHREHRQSEVTRRQLDAEVEPRPPADQVSLRDDLAIDADDDHLRPARRPAGDAPERDLVRSGRDQLWWRERGGQRARLDSGVAKYKGQLKVTSARALRGR